MYKSLAIVLITSLIVVIGNQTAHSQQALITPDGTTAAGKLRVLFVFTPGTASNISGKQERGSLQQFALKGHDCQ